eukprot:359595-Chlamydomonas_euryale.AAC.2
MATRADSWYVAKRRFERWSARRSTGLFCQAVERLHHGCIKQRVAASAVLQGCWPIYLQIRASACSRAGELRT